MRATDNDGMVPQHSYALIPFRRKAGGIEVLIGHMGGPFWARKDVGAWSFPKGLPEATDSDGLAAACREFYEELGLEAPTDGFIELGDIKQSGGKVVTGWAVEADPNLAGFSPGAFSLEWPPQSGQIQDFPEIDRIAWASPDEAQRLLVTAQREFVLRLLQIVSR